MAKLEVSACSALLLLALSGPASGAGPESANARSAPSSSSVKAERPPSAMDELMTLSDVAKRDTRLAFAAESRSVLGSRTWTVADHAPWDDSDVCRQSRKQYLQAFAQYMRLHVRPSPNGIPWENASFLAVMEGRLREDIERVATSLPPRGQALFLEEKESLRPRADSWNQALRQRAEWIAVLGEVVSNLKRIAHRNPDFGASYAAGIWTPLACDFTYNRRFLDRWMEQAGTPSTPKDKAALELMKQVVPQP